MENPMTAVFEWALANAVLALLLALPAYASRWLRRPAVTHALWLLVLLRLIVPPMWHVPIPVYAGMAAPAQATPIVNSMPPTTENTEFEMEPAEMPFIWSEPPTSE